jgi:hypothetical protein
MAGWKNLRKNSEHHYYQSGREGHSKEWGKGVPVVFSQGLEQNAQAR